MLATWQWADTFVYSLPRLLATTPLMSVMQKQVRDGGSRRVAAAAAAASVCTRYGRITIKVKRNSLLVVISSPSKFARHNTHFVKVSDS